MQVKNEKIILILILLLSLYSVIFAYIALYMVTSSYLIFFVIIILFLTFKDCTASVVHPSVLTTLGYSQTFASFCVKSVDGGIFQPVNEFCCCAKLRC